jgi:endo-alpha-N-acetylgalactosaminidase
MTDNNETYTWVPGMKAELKTEDQAHTLTIERQSNDFTGNKTGYRTRTMNYDGIKIYEGMEGDTKYLIPWLWDKDGNVVNSEDEKIIPLEHTRRYNNMDCTCWMERKC